MLAGIASRIPPASGWACAKLPTDLQVQACANAEANARAYRCQCVSTMDIVTSVRARVFLV
eukprot:10111765-Lingulodinium_polyedra.AAC.1